MDRQYSLDLFPTAGGVSDMPQPSLPEKPARPVVGDDVAATVPEPAPAMLPNDSDREVAPEGDAAPQAEPFGRWLLAQVGRGDWIDDLARAARADAGFPKSGTADDVRARLGAFGIEGDVYEQVDDAERCWLAETQP